MRFGGGCGTGLQRKRVLAGGTGDCRQSCRTEQYLGGDQQDLGVLHGHLPHPRGRKTRCQILTRPHPVRARGDAAGGAPGIESEILAKGIVDFLIAKIPPSEMALWRTAVYLFSVL